MKTPLVILLAALIMIPAGSSDAQITGENVSLIGGIGSWEPDDAEERGFLFYGGVRIAATEKLLLEGTIGRWRAEEDLKLNGTVVGDVSARTIPISVSGLLYFPLSQRTPIFAYGGGGIDYHMWKSEAKLKEGYQFQDGSTSADDDDTSFGFHFRGGIEYKATPQVHIGGEFKYFSGEVDDWDFDYNGMCLMGFLRYLFRA